MDEKTEKQIFRGNVINVLTIAFCIWSGMSGYPLATLIKVLTILMLIISPLGAFIHWAGMIPLSKTTKVISTLTDITIFMYFVTMGSTFFATLQALQWIICELGHYSLHNKGFDFMKEYFHDNMEEDKIPDIYKD